MTITPRGGRHVMIFVADRDSSIEIRNSAGKIGPPGIDVRGEGGYVCLPPSRNANGGVYRWDPDGGRAGRPGAGLADRARPQQTKGAQYGMGPRRTGP